MKENEDEKRLEGGKTIDNHDVPEILELTVMTRNRPHRLHTRPGRILRLILLPCSQAGVASQVQTRLWTSAPLPSHPSGSPRRLHSFCCAIHQKPSRCYLLLILQTEAEAVFLGCITHKTPVWCHEGGKDTWLKNPTVWDVFGLKRMRMIPKFRFVQRKPLDNRREDLKVS